MVYVGEASDIKPESAAVTQARVNTRKLEIMGVIMSNFILRQQKHIFPNVFLFFFPFYQFSCE